jgi:hypothetical protein
MTRRSSRLRERGKFLGVVEAPNLETAIKAAIEQFQITNPERQKRLIAILAGS